MNELHCPDKTNCRDKECISSKYTESYQKQQLAPIYTIADRVWEKGERVILEILPIRQIQKGSGIQISPLQTTSHLRLDSITAFVLPTKQKTERGNEHDFDKVADDH